GRLVARKDEPLAGADGAPAPEAAIQPAELFDRGVVLARDLTERLPGTDVRDAARRDGEHVAGPEDGGRPQLVGERKVPDADVVAARDAGQRVAGANPMLALSGCVLRCEREARAAHEHENPQPLTPPHGGRVLGTRSARSTAEAGSGLRAGHLLLDELHVLAHDRIELLDLQLLRLGALVLRGVVVVAGAGARH